jgi:hypothetical protein
MTDKKVKPMVRKKGAGSATFVGRCTAGGDMAEVGDAGADVPDETADESSLR